MLNSVRGKDGEVTWTARVTGSGVTQGAQVFSPPALGRRNMFLCSAQGHLLAVDSKTGRTVFAYNLKQPMVFQPALAGGAMYMGTANGLLICLKTRSKDATGWTAWGGNARHNK